MGYKANITSNLINQILRIAIGALISILVARQLGPTGMGYVAYIILIVTLLGDYGHFGLNNAVMYFKKRRDIQPEQLFNTNVTALGLIFLLITSVLLLIKSTGLAFAAYNYLYLLGGLLFILSDMLFTNSNSWLIGDERIKESNRSILIAFFLKNAAILLLWLIHSLTPFSFFAVSVLAMLLNALLLGLRVRHSYHPAIDLRLLRSEFSYGGIIWLAAIFSFLHFRIDQFLIKQILGVSDLGVYSVAVTLAELMFLIPLSINTALLGKLYNTSDPASSRRVMSQTLKISLYVCVALAAVGIPLCLLIPVFYGAAYSGAVFSAMILLLGGVFASIAKVSAQYFFTIGKPVFHLLITFAILCLNILLNLLLIPRYGIAGSALASTITYAIYGLFYLSLFLLREKYTLREIFLLQSDDIKAFFHRDR